MRGQRNATHVRPVPSGRGRPVDGGPGAARRDARRRHTVVRGAGGRRPVERLTATPRHTGDGGEPGRLRSVAPPPHPGGRRSGWAPALRRLFVLALLALAVLVFLLGRPVEAESASHEVVPVAYVVEPGDTVWGIARSIAGPDEDVRAVVERIRQMNELGGGLRAGSVIVVPTRVGG